MAPSDCEQKKGYGQTGQYLNAGFQFAASILLCLLGGWWLDGKLSTSPLFLMLGTFFGAGAGFYHLYRSLVGRGKDEEKN